MAGKLSYGPTMLHVGERSPNDKRYATDEYAFVNPGRGGSVVVAPRLKGEEPNMANAVAAVLRQIGGTDVGGKSGLREAAMGMLFSGKKKAKKGHHMMSNGTMMKDSEMKRAAEGVQVGDPSVFNASALLSALLQQLGSAGQTFAVEVPSVQQALAGQLGYFNPATYGITDPQQFRIMTMLGMLSPEQEAAVRAKIQALGAPESDPYEALYGQAATSGRPGGPEGRNIIEDMLRSFELRVPTLQAQQLRTERELRGLSPAAGAGAMPSFRM